ncbi:hypothetical protein HDU79_000285 [Rhizoclosmatium sp. JEL0117]|nr:hypothetical protein HDU79_000285 [Rhizoclosmatium sp. JEL0117]
MNPASPDVNVLIAALVIVTVLLLFTVYHNIVPSASIELGSLASVNPKVRHIVDKHYPIAPDAKMAPSRLGPTYYRLLGKEDGERILLIHGISGTWASMPQIPEYLVAQGYRVCIYDVYGRGYSASPGVKYDHATYTQQIHDLLTHISWTRASIIAYSMGGAISVCFAAAYPEMVDRLILAAPAGLLERLPVDGRLVGVPVLGPLFVSLFGRRYLLRSSLADYADGPYGKEPHMLHFAAVQELNFLHNPGLLRAYISTITDGPISRIHGAYERVGKLLGNKVLCVWGTADTIVEHKTLMPHFRRLMPKAKVIELEGRSHAFVPETFEALLEPAVEFLKDRQ